MAIRKLCLIVPLSYETLHLMFKITFVIEPDSDLCSKVAASSHIMIIGGLSPQSSPFSMPLACVSHLCECAQPSSVFFLVPRMVSFFCKYYCIYSVNRHGDSTESGGLASHWCCITKLVLLGARVQEHKAGIAWNTLGEPNMRRFFSSEMNLAC